MSHGDRPWADEVVEQLNLIREELAEARREREQILKRIEGIESRVGFPEALSKALGLQAIEEHAALPSSGLSRQERRAIERACAADPTEGAQRVDLFDLGWVTYTKPGADPKVTSSNLETLPGEEAVNGDAQRTPHSHRAGRH